MLALRVAETSFATVILLLELYHYAIDMHRSYATEHQTAVGAEGLPQVVEPIQTRANSFALVYALLMPTRVLTYISHMPQRGRHDG